MDPVVISPIIEVVIGKLGSCIWKEIGLLWGVDDDIQKLRRLLLTISAVLNEAERRSISDGTLRNWLRDLKDAAFEVDDVVDEFQTEALRRRMEGHSSITRKVRDLFFNHNPIAFRIKIARKIEDVIRRLNQIAEERKCFHLVEISVSERHTQRETCSFVVESRVYGRNVDKDKVIDFLMDTEYDDNVSILPIVGLGGVGKTTLVQLVYNDMMITEHFDLRMWVCIAEDFDVKHIASAVLQSSMPTKCQPLDFETVQCTLRQQLKDKRYLLVLDDVWNENAAEWERLESLLNVCKQGSKILVTTRSETVGRIMGMAVTPYRLDVLSTDDCWIIFRQMAFGPGREEETPNLIEAGRDIISKCGGLPLAAKALGSLMASKRGESEWLAVKDSEIWKLPEAEDEILPALRLSYDHLPPHLKQCFAYCSLFPKDYEIDRLKLVQMWIAEGFIKLSDEAICAEDVGNQYFNCLLWRSFFQDEKRDEFGNIVLCKMHDLVHDLVCSIARAGSSVVELSSQRSVFHGCRYSSVISDDGIRSLTTGASSEVKKLRTLLFSRSQYLTRHAILNLGNLRVLNLSGTLCEEALNAVGKLKHLRFLDVSHTCIHALPDSITSLYNLQTLNLRNCRKLKMLPKRMKNMSNLRHLDISQCHELTRMPPGLGKLHKLQTLPLFIVGDEPGSSIVELQDLNLLRSELKIRCLGNVIDPAEAMEAEIGAKTSLQSLELYWDRGAVDAALPTPASGNNLDENVLENLQPHSRIKHFTIEGYDGNVFPKWLTNPEALSQFSYLKKLSIYNLKRCEYLPLLGQLPSLKHLVIHFLNAIKIIGQEFYGEAGTFPSLEYLMLCRLPNLEEWSIPSMDMFPSLKILIVEWCPKLSIKPHLPSSLEELKIASRCNEKLLSAEGCLRGLSRLRLLCIVDIKSSSSGWEGMQYLTALEVLKIGYCEELICLPEGVTQQYLPSLRTLELVNNYNLVAFGEGRGGEQAQYPQQQQQPPLSFSSLHHLIVRGCRALTAVPDWLGSLTSLQSLKISRCHNLAILPDSLQQLTTLQHLTIDCCRVLEKRCEKESGDDWHKIAHVPNIHIN